MKQSKLFIIVFYCFMLLIFTACQTTNNPASEGFNLKDSDPKAITVADEVMNAMGSRKAWDNTRYLKWNFFGSRQHVWDKKTGNIRIDSKKDNFTVLMNIFTQNGKVKKDGVEHTHPDSIKVYLEKGMSAWINDSYWLVMPFKLKDSGVRLKYIGKEKTQTGQMADVLELTFANVGKTPDNKYHVFVDETSRLVTQWTFFTKATDPEPRFSTPWDGYKKYGNILLSGGRGKYELTDIEVPNQVPDNVFTAY